MYVSGSSTPQGNDTGFEEASINTDSREEEIHLLLQKIETFDAGDHESRVPLLCRLNDIRPSTRSLSNEILTDIFYRIVNDEQSKHVRPQFIIGAVSSHWRAVVWNTPNLWTQIKWNLFTSFSSGYRPLLETHLNNSGPLPVSVEFSKGNRGRIGEDEMDMFVDVMSMPQYVHKVQGLHHFHAQLLPLLPHRLPALRQVSLTFVTLMPIPTPAAYDLTDVWPSLSMQLPWRGITHLLLRDVPVDVCIELLKGCPDLVIFAADSSDLPLRSGGREKEVGVHAHLQSITWRIGLATIPDTMFLNMHFPEARHVGFSTPYSLNYRGEFKKQFTKFLSNLPPSFESFELFPFISDEHLCRDWLLDVFGWVPYITKLVLQEYWMLEFWEFMSILRGSSLLPFLESLKYAYSGNIQVGDAEITSDFFEFVENRKERGFGGFRLEVVNLTVRFAPGVRQQLEDLVCEEFVLEIIQNGVTVDWLSMK